MKYLLLFTAYCMAMYGWYVYTKSKDLLNPVLAFSAPVFVSVVINLIFFDGRNYEITAGTYAVYLLGIVSFVSGCTMAYQPSRVKRTYAASELNYNPVLFSLYQLIASAGTVATVFYMVRAASSGYFGSNVIRNIRYYSLYVQQNSLLGKYSVVFIEVLFCVYAYKRFVLREKSRKTKIWFFVITAEYVLAIAATMARTVLLQFVLEFACFFFYGLQMNDAKKRKKRLRPKMIVLGMAALAVMQFLAERTQKTSFADEITGQPVHWLITYFGKQFYNFDAYISSHAWVTRGIHSFGFFGRLFQRLGLLLPKHPIDIPGGQVASFIAGPYTDFGIAGVVMVTAIYGCIIGYIYKRAIARCGWWMVFYAICVYSCMIAFYAFQFMMSSHLYAAVLITALFCDGRGIIRLDRRKD